MKFKVGIFVALLSLSAVASAKTTAVTVDGVSYVRIQDVHVVSGGRIVLMFASGGTTVTPDKLPPGFLESWGIKDAEIAASKAAANKSAEQSLAQSIHGGYFREVDGIVYDLRKVQPGWKQFTDVKILQVVEGGALVELAEYQANPTAVFVRNLPHIFADNEKASFMAKLAGDFSYINKYGFEHTIHAYDTGHICQRHEIPEVMIKNNLAAAASPNAALHPRAGSHPQRIAAGDDGLKGNGSGFFITKDGYLLTNFHVVREAQKIKVVYKSHALPAEVVQVDDKNDLALLKVSGTDFPTLAIARQDPDLGDEVFTIGFPNILMQGKEPKYTDGKISSLAGMQDDATEYQISVPVQPGNSGGPLCNAEGEVVGVVVARLNDMATLRETGAVPQNVNYAVKAKLALSLLQGVKGLDAVLTPLTPGPKPSKPVQAAEAATVMVEIY